MPITIKNTAGGGVTLDSTTSNNETVNLPTGGGNLITTTGATFTGNVTHNDGVQAKWGTSGDFSIRHDGSNTYLQDAGSGDLIIKSNGTNVKIIGDNDEDIARFTWNGSTQLYYNGSKKIETTATGVAVTGGIALGGTGAANTLDDYEEGNWTPADTGGGTVAVLDSRYTKIGRLVHLTAYIQFTGIGSSGNTVQLNGLPFAVISNSGQAVGNVMCNLVTSNSGAFNAASYMSATTIKFYQSCSNGGWQPFKHVANITVNDLIYFNATYFTDA